jgi:hypothetical protein
MYQRPNREVLIDTTLVAGTAAYAAPQSANSALLGLEPRPAGRYAYGTCLRYELGFTATPGGAVDLEPEDIVQALKSVFLSYAGMTRRNNLSGLNIVRLSQQADENLTPDVIADYIPITALLFGGGAQAVNLCIVDPLGIQFPKGKRGSKHTGLIPLSALKKGADLKVTCIGTTAIAAGWTIANITLKVTLLTQEFDEPLEHVAVYEEFLDFSTTKAVLPGVGDRLYSAILLTDDAAANFTQPTAGSMNVDGDTILSQVDGDDVVRDEDMGRMVGINDIYPRVCPLVTMTGRDLDEALPVRDTITLLGMGDAHLATGSNYGVLVRYSKKLDRNTQRKIQIDHGVPAEVVDRFLDEMTEKPNVPGSTGRVTVVMRAS